jgi:tetratricopeptide (TPR) repeat protein
MHLLSGARCPSGETELRWARAGPRGAIGPEGPPGPRGESSWHPHGDQWDHRHHGSTQSIWGTIVEVAWGSVAAVLAVLLAPLIIGLAMMQLLTRLPWTKNSRLVRRIRPSSFVVELLDDSAVDGRIGPAITGLVRNRISVREDRFGLDYVTGQRIVKKTLKPFKDLSASFPNLSGNAGAVVAVVEFLARTIPRRRFVLRGELQPAASAGPGVTLALQDSSADDSLTVLWATPFEIRSIDTAAYERLAIPSAAWADHRLATALARGGLSELVSRDADSWALFRAGLECHRLGEDEQARSLYEQALGHDGRNLGALANLGLLERRERHFARAEGLLESARAELEGRGGSFHRNPDWYRIRYQLAALYLNRASLNKGRARLADDVSRAREEATAIVRDSVKILISPEEVPSIWRRYRLSQSAASIREEHGELSDFLSATIAPAALTLLAGLLQIDGEPHPPIVREPITLHSYEEVGQALGTPGLTGEALVAFVERQTQLAPRVYYNLACYHTTRRRRQRATEWLEQAFLHTPITERYALLRVVEKDTTLAPLTADPDLVQRLREYLPPRA